MKMTIRCGRCNSQLDIEEGTRISTCYSPVNKSFTGHSIEVDPDTAEGKAIIAHIERKPTSKAHIAFELDKPARNKNKKK